MEPLLTHRIARRDAELALERAHTDADWLASLRAAYQGRHDVLDALWWVAYPLTATPAGIPDPAEGLPELQRAVFSRAAEGSPVIEVVDPQNATVLRMSEAEHRLGDLQRQLAADARSLGQAWLAVHPAPAIVEDEAGEAEVSTFIEASARQIAVVPEPGAEGEPPGETPLDTAGSLEEGIPRSRKLLFPALAGVGLLAGILVIPTLTGLGSGAESEPAAIPTTPTTTPHARMDIVTVISDGNVSDPHAVLARPAVETDQPRFQPGELFDPESFRRLPDLVGFLELYLARGEQDSICLVVIRHDDVSHGSCVTEAVFAQRGIDLGSSGDRYQVGVDMTILSESFTLLSNGDFHYDARARAPQLMPDRDTVLPGAEEHFLGT